MKALELLDAAVAELARLDPASLELPDLQALALDVERAAGRLRGMASAALGEVEARGVENVGWWWRDNLGISGEAAGIAVRRSKALRDLPVVRDAVVDGVLSLEQAGALTPLVGKVDEAELIDNQDLMVEGARGRTVDGIGQWVRLLIAAHSEQALDNEQAAASDRRFLKHRLTPDGLLRGSFALAAEDAEPFLSVLEPLARKDGNADTRTAAQRRADALVEVFAGAARWAKLPDAGGQRAQVSYVLPAAWAAGLGGVPASGAWTGPQTRSRLEAVLCDARLSRVLLDDAGQVLRLESVHGEITLAQRRAVSARDGCCTGPGCTRPPAFCDVHHLLERAKGGLSVLWNLVLLCRRHHLMWHLGKLGIADLRLPWLMAA
jgi:hypothetical protein